jgi:hypothetical protein
MNHAPTTIVSVGQAPAFSGSRAERRKAARDRARVMMQLDALTQLACFGASPAARP